MSTDFERTTKKSASGSIVWLDKATKKTYTAEEMTPQMIAIALTRLARYEEVQDQGRLIVLKTKIGDNVFLRHEFHSSSGATNVVAVPVPVKAVKIDDAGNVILTVAVSDDVYMEVGSNDYHATKEEALGSQNVDPKNSAK